MSHLWVEVATRGCRVRTRRGGDGCGDRGGSDRDRARNRLGDHVAGHRGAPVDGGLLARGLDLADRDVSNVVHDVAGG
ncbi:MAG: hypothetical protein ACI8V4_000497 [Ilumatobacter sp.]|jgi:hypothetical protein